MTNKKSNTLRKIISASMAVLSIMSIGTTALADGTSGIPESISAYETISNDIEADVIESFDFSGLMPSCAENVKNTYKERYPNQSELIDSIVDSIISDIEFIRYFEAEGPVAFQVVADALDDSLETKNSLYGFKDECHFSEYSSYPCKQLYTYYDGPAAVVMALMGSGCIDYTQNKNDLDNNQRAAAAAMGTTAANNTSIYKITSYLQDKYQEKFGANTSGTFQTRVFNSSNSYEILSYIKSSLSWDTEPILKIPDRSILYNHRDETGSLYVTVNLTDDQSECIVFTDPTEERGSGHSLSYDELEALTDSGNVWLSTYYSKSSKEFPLAAYPASEYVSGKGALSYYTNNGKPCENHKVSESNCMYYDGGWQCYAFANYIYYVTNGKKCSDGKRNYINLYYSNESTLKSYLQGLPTGTHLRIKTTNGTEHSMALISTSSQGITVYHANYDNHCGVYYDTFTWGEYAKNFPTLLYYVTLK